MAKSNLERLAEQVAATVSGSAAVAEPGSSEALTTIDQSEPILSDCSPTGERQITLLVEAQPAPKNIPVQPQPLTNGGLSTTADLSAFLAALNPDQMAKIRSLAAARGISSGPRRGPGGGLVVEIEIPAEACEPLQVWAEEAGSTFAEFVSKVAGDAIVNYCFGDWSATRVEPVAAAAAVAPVVTAGAPGA